MLKPQHLLALMRISARFVADNFFVANNRGLVVCCPTGIALCFCCAVRLVFVPLWHARRPILLLVLVRRAAVLMDLLLHVPLLLVLL